MKKLLIIAGVFLLQTTNTFAFYNDVPTTYQYYSEIKALYDQNRLPKSTNFAPDTSVTPSVLNELILGYTQTSPSSGIKFITTTNPTKTLAKKQILSTTFQVLGIGTPFFFDSSQFPFIDVALNSETSSIAMKAAEIGIFENTPNLFGTAKRISKGKFAHYLYLIQQYSPSSTPLINPPIPQTSNYTTSQQELLNNENFNTLLSVWETLKTNFLYTDELNDDDLIIGAIKGLVSEVEDKYTTFEDPEAAAQFLQSLSNEYEGIGMSVDLIDDNITVVTPFKGSPAEKAGIKSNDIITEINGENILGQSLLETISKIVGPAGTTVELKVLRGDKFLYFTITREAITYNSVNYRFLTSKNGNKIAYIEILNFGETTSDQFTSAANSIISNNPSGVIVDLRNNPGGLLSAAVDITSLFTDEYKTVTTLEFANGQKLVEKTNSDGRLSNYKIVVLINEGSASASEILAGALQDYEIAEIIGTQSFGKGTVQNIDSFQDGSIFKYTTAKWLTPNGKNIHGIGISPDIISKNTNTNSDDQLTVALSKF